MSNGLDFGTAIGLIKGLGSPDPAVIESAVSDWLDDHPEATTTVQDGSITKAKLDSNLQGTVDDVADLKSQMTLVDDAIYTLTPKTVAATANSWRLNDTNGLCHSDNGYKLVKYTVTAGDLVEVVSDDKWQFQNSSSVPSSGTSNRVGDTTYGVGKFIMAVPTGATYLIVSTPTNGIAAAYGVRTVKEDVTEHSDVIYKHTSNLLDFGYLGGTWLRGGVGDSNSYMCKLKTPIAASEGDVFYGAINKSKYDDVFSFGSFTLYAVALDQNGDQIGNYANLSTISNQSTGKFTVPSGAAAVTVVFSTGVYNDKFTPTDLDNAAEAFAYFGRDDISFNDIYANYTPYPAYNADAISAHEQEFEEFKDVDVGALIDFDISQISKLNVGNTLYGYKSSRYIARTTNDTWVSDSHVRIQNIPVTSGQAVCFGCIASHSTGTNAGNVYFYNSLGETIKNVYLYASYKNRAGGFVRTLVAPEGTVSANFVLYGITSGGTVIGETYYVYGGFFYVGNLAWHLKTIPEEWENAIPIMQTQQGASLAFGIQTDTHYYRGLSLNLGFNLNEMSNIMGLDFIANLGDLIQGYNLGEVDSIANTRAAMTDIVRRYTENAGCPVIIAPGNHDSGKENANRTGEDEMSNSEIFARMIKPCIIKNSRAVCENGNLYYYCDFPAARVIMLNTGDNGEHISTFGISTTQESWFINTALDTDKPVLVLSHVPLVSEFESNYSQTFTRIVNALQSFKANGGKVIACLCGHKHAEMDFVVDGINYISFTQNYLLADTTASFVFVDTAAKTIKIYGFGSATDREFSYT